MKKDINGSATLQSNEGTINNAESNNANVLNDSKAVAEKTFSHADLWNIQRQRRSLMVRRYSF